MSEGDVGAWGEGGGDSTFSREECGKITKRGKRKWRGRMSDREGEITKGMGQEGIKGKARGGRHDITNVGERHV